MALRHQVVRVLLGLHPCHRDIDQNSSSSSGGGTASIDAMTRRAVWGCLLATVTALPDCLVELEGVAGYVSTQVDVLSPEHGKRYTEGEAIPLGLEVQAWPVEIAARRDVRLCVVLDELEPACIPVADQSLPTLQDLRLGEHVVEAYLALDNMTRLDCNLREHDSVAFHVEPPRNATTILLSELPDKSHVDGLIVRVHVFQVAVVEDLRTWVRLVDENGMVRDKQPCRAYVTSMRRACGDLRAPFPGIYTIQAEGASSIEVHVRGSTGDDLTLITAADAKYFERLSNFIGSVHFWEPFLHVDIYDLGLAPEQLSHVKEWDRTSLFKTSYADIPLVGWKFAVVLDALTRHSHVIWMDANAELRRPLTAIRHALNEKGYFLTVAGHRFPTPKTVRPATLQHFDCQAAFASMPECTSAYLGVVRGSELHALLPSLDKCASSRDCLYPKDAVGNTNQRRDQSVLNAALCDASITCDADRKFWMWAGQKVFTPTEDPSMWNSLVLFSRRGHGAPYSPRDVAAWNDKRRAAVSSRVPTTPQTAERRGSGNWHFGDL